MKREFICRCYDKYLGEVIRFCIVGCVSALCLYIVYYIFLYFFTPTISYSIGYFVSFSINYLLSVFFTFKVKSKGTKFLGFALSHIINYTLQVILLNLFILWGCEKILAPLPVLGICIPINYIMVRSFLKK